MSNYLIDSPSIAIFKSEPQLISNIPFEQSVCAFVSDKIGKNLKIFIFLNFSLFKNCLIKMAVFD